MRVLVIGGGPAGVSAALHAAELGAEVTLIERGRVGGTAFNSGPAPVRTLARAARLVRDWSSWEAFGLRGLRPEVDLAATLANAQRVAEDLHERKRVADHIRSFGVDLVEEAGDTRFVDAHTLAAADGRTWTADRMIIAVGGRAATAIPGAELGLTYEDVRSVTALPERVCVIGAADTGCQLTSILADFGCAVTLVEYGPRIVPRADVDVRPRSNTLSGGAASRSSPAPRSTSWRDSNPVCAFSTRSATTPEQSMWTPRSSLSVGPATPTSSTPPLQAWSQSVAM